jgi:phosphoribosylanthranilate isomerase
MRTRVKICGITNMDDAVSAVESGADALGFIFFEKSPRFIEEEEARSIVSRVPPYVTTVGVFVNEEPKEINRIVKSAGLDRVQLHGAEGPEVCRAIEAKVIKAARISGKEDLQGLDRYDVSAFLLDTFREGVEGGTGQTFDWDIALEAKKLGTVILSGGLTTENVVDAINHVRPWGVDVTSGVEKEPGKKDPEKIKRFIERVRSV